MHSQPTGSALTRFFAGIAESTFQVRFGMADPPLIDYLAELLVRFTRSDVMYRVRRPDGRKVEEVAELLHEAQARVGDARREVHRHVGDFTLFWAGVYPESLERLQGTERKDFLLDYCEQGKRAYYLASRIETESEEAAPAEVLERLSEQFELCVFGLREVRREWERVDEGDSPGLFLIN